MKTALATAAALAALLIAAAAPAQGPAQPLVTSDVPDHWRALPELASPARRAFEDLGADVDATAQAWGDPAAGVYSLLLTGRANVIARPRHRVAIATDVHDQLRGLLEVRGAAVHPWTSDTDARAVTSRAVVEQYGQRGELVMWSGYDDEGRLLTSIALCFRNDRVVERTERECAAWFASLRSTVSPVPLDPNPDGHDDNDDKSDDADEVGR